MPTPTSPAPVSPTVPPLIIPSVKPMDPIAGWDKPLKIRHVTGIDVWALFFNLVSALIFFAVPFAIIAVICKVKNLQPHPMILYGIPVCLVSTLTIFNYERLWIVEVPARQAVIFLDLLFRDIIVYTQGFHFTPWLARRQPDEINYQKHEDVSSGKGDIPKILCQTADGYEMEADTKTFFSRLGDETSLGRSLKYQLPEIRIIVHAGVMSRLSDIVGCNNYEVLLARKAEVADWLGNIFGGESTITPFEAALGISIRNPILGSFGLSPESQKTRGGKAKLSLMESQIRALKDAGVSPNEASLATQAALGIAPRSINTQEYQGIPSGVRTFAPGNNGVTIK